MYVTKKHLAELVKASQTKGVVSTDLVDAFLLIAHGWYRRERSNLRVDEEDYKQECCLRLLSDFHKLRADDGLFGYFTQMCKYALWAQAKKRDQYDHLTKQFYDFKMK